MTANHFPNLYADKAAAEIETAKSYLWAALERLDQCEAMMETDGDWATIARLADMAFTNVEDGRLPLGRVGTYASKRASFS